MLEGSTYGFRFRRKCYVWGNFSHHGPRDFGHDRMVELKDRIKTTSCLEEWKERLPNLVENRDADNPNQIDLMEILMSGGNPTICRIEKQRKSTLEYALSQGYYQSDKFQGLVYSYIVDLDDEAFIFRDNKSEESVSIPFDGIPEENLADFLARSGYSTINEEDEDSTDSDSGDSILGKRKRDSDEPVDPDFNDGRKIEKHEKKRKLDF